MKHRRYHSLYALLALALAASVHAGDDPTLYSDALTLERNAQPAPRALYVGSAPGELLVRNVALLVDGRTAGRYEYSETEARAMQAGALHELAALPAGMHRLRAEIMAVGAQAQSYGARTRLTIEWECPDGATPLLSLQQAGTLKKPALVIQPLGDAAGAMLRVADFLEADRRWFDAAALLLRAQAAYKDTVPAETDRRIAGNLARLAGRGPEATAAPGLEVYNRAMDRIAQGHEAEGIALLGTLADGETADEAGAWLRDRANLSLGHALLRRGERDAAIAAWQRVRSPGPFTSRALLAMGWAWVLPRNAQPRPASYAMPGDDTAAAELRRRMPFRKTGGVAGKDGAQALRHALVPWTELTGRDPLDPAVQEGMLALPYALSHLGAQVQAAQRHEQGIAALESASAFLDAASRRVNSGMLADLDRYLNREGSGWNRQWGDLAPVRRWWTGEADAASLAYLDYLLEDDAWYETLERYRDARLLQRRLQAPAPGAPREQVVALQTRAAAVGTQAARDLQALALAALEKRRTQTAQYLAEAHLALARFNDVAAVAVAP